MSEAERWFLTIHGVIGRHPNCRVVAGVFVNSLFPQLPVIQDDEVSHVLFSG